MGCNCKNKKPAPVDDLVGFELINKGIIRNEPISVGEKEMLYTYYNQRFEESIAYTCRNCWEGFVKEKLRELWIRESLERAQS